MRGEPYRRGAAGGTEGRRGAVDGGASPDPELPPIGALVLAAFDDVAGVPGELRLWLDAHEFAASVAVEGVPEPVRVTREGLAVALTGIGKAAAATTVAAILASGRLDLDGALFLSVGVAGGPPDLAVGSVVIADAVVDWDHKLRVDPGSDERAIAENPYTGGASYDLEPDLVDWALEIAQAVDLPAGGGNGPEGPSEAVVVTGTNVSGDELWHGVELARQVEWLLDRRGAGPCQATEMEDAGTCCALERFDRLDRYLSIRGISNPDRPAPGTPGLESLGGPAFDAGFEPARRNATAVAREVIDRWGR